MWRTKLTDTDLDNMAKAARANYWDKADPMAGKADTEPSPESMAAWRGVVEDMLDTAQTVGIVPTEHELRGSEATLGREGETVRVAVDALGKRFSTKLHLGPNYREMRGDMSDHYVEVTTRKTAELVVRAALKHVWEVHREAH